MPEVKRPNRFDWLIYRLFRWRWNPIFESNKRLLEGFRYFVNRENVTSQPKGGGEE